MIVQRIFGLCDYTDTRLRDWAIVREFVANNKWRNVAVGSKYDK